MSARRRGLLRAGLSAALLPLAGQAWAQQGGYIGRKLDARVPGGVAVVALGQAGQAPKAWYGKHRVMVVRDDTQAWIAVVGIPLSVKPGTESLRVQDASGERTVSFKVQAKTYKSQYITLRNKRHVSPAPDDLRRFERELAEQLRAYAAFREDAIPSNVLLDRPVSGGRLSSPFGLRRFFNGEERNPHSGLDFAVPAGTPIAAPAAGRVVLVGDYFFNGKTVFVDHGQGFISMFCHMSRIDVRVGDELPRGAIVGAVGATGRATGPHLHWNVSLNNVRVDPAIFIGAFQP